jgi:replicative DNA helicase Mcm
MPLILIIDFSHFETRCSLHKKTPKSIYGSGDNMSAAGLSASVEKDELRGKWIARGGLLSRANKSLVIIDEITKLRSNDKKALHTPMEQGLIIVDKAGIHIQMNADCSILACCNPKNGSFDTSGYNSVSEEVTLPEAIISRFDLIYYIQDKINSEKDKQIINSLFKDKKEEGEINSVLFKKYISRASKINPYLSEEVKDTLQDLYQKLRETSKNSLEKITSRQAGGIIRLAVANAKIRMSEVVELEDLSIAEELMLDALQSVGFERKLNALDQASIYTNTTRKKIHVTEQVVEIIKSLINSGENEESKIKNFLLEKGYSTIRIERIFDGLKKEGSIIGTKQLTWYHG